MLSAADLESWMSDEVDRAANDLRHAVRLQTSAGYDVTLPAPTRKLLAGFRNGDRLGLSQLDDLRRALRQAIDP